MSSSIQTNGERFNGLDKTNSATIRRTFIERGIRPIVNNQTYSNGLSTTNSTIPTTNPTIPTTNPTIPTINKQHQDEQRELQELNTKLSNYLSHVHNLETFNGQLLAEIDEIRRKWGDNTEQVNKTHNPQLRAIRDGINDSLRDQIFQELQLKRYEYDIEQSQERINAFDDDTTNRLNTVQEELNKSINDLENLKNQFDQYSTDLIEQRNYLENLDNEFDGLQIELLNHRLERIMVENELQTLREHAAFQKANYQAEREEILSLNIPAVDLSKFYRDELVHAIADIRKDFEILSQTRLQQYEEYYRIKTEELHQRIAKESERKSLLNIDDEETDMNSVFSLLTDTNEEYKQLKLENNQLDIDLNDTLDDLKRIREEQIRENEKLDLEFNQLQQEFENKQDTVNKATENNISLQFELSTYRNLLNSEEKRINRNQQEQQIQTSTSPKPKEIMKGFSVKKIAVKKTSTGPIVFDSIDFVNDCVVIAYDRPTGNNQSLDKWTLRHQNDQQSEKVFQFPSSLVLKPRQTIRILSKLSPPSARTENDFLIADQIETWGQGQVMVTRLIDNNNQERATLTQTRLPI